VNRIHLGAERHVRGRIEFAGIGKMLEQFGKATKAQPVVSRPCGSISVDSFFLITDMGRPNI
jgi:hypothetical protein